VQQWDQPCALCGSTNTFLDELIMDNDGLRMFVCSDSDHCQSVQATAEASA
jgi:alpha-D-ribose 1-methylphosphonate 5-phosphate C-P lyase